MITLTLLALILGVVIIVISGVGVILLDPIIAILVVMGLYKFVKKFIFKK